MKVSPVGRITTSLRAALAVSMIASAGAAQLAGGHRPQVGGDALAAIDPAVLRQTFALRNRYLSMTDGTYRDSLSAELAHPFNEAWRGRVSMPIVFTDQLDESTSTGDLRLGLDWIANRRDAFALIFNLDGILDTSSEPAGGRGQNSIAPGVTMVFRTGENTVIAPSYEHTFSVSGHEWRPEIDEGVASVYVGSTFKDGRAWFGVIPSALLDLEGETEFFAAEFELGMVANDRSSLYVRPGVGFSSEDTGAVGADYPYDWAVELGWIATF